GVCPPLKMRISEWYDLSEENIQALQDRIWKLCQNKGALEKAKTTLIDLYRFPKSAKEKPWPHMNEMIWISGDGDAEKIVGLIDELLRPPAASVQAEIKLVIKETYFRETFFNGNRSYRNSIGGDVAMQDAAGKSLGLDGRPEINVQLTATTDGKVKFKTITITNWNGNTAEPDNELPQKMKTVMDNYLAMPTLAPGSGAELMEEMKIAMEQTYENDPIVKVLRGSDLFLQADGSYQARFNTDRAVQDAARQALKLDDDPYVIVQLTTTTDGKVKFKIITITNSNGKTAVPDNALPQKMQAVMDSYLAMTSLAPGSGATLMEKMGAAMEEDFRKK
ncbi:MAG: hypothetical protein PHZ00_06825, partial [Candidatus Peribacteraceae bacterium]|nr:hypothetical protein [Candidatus Peribacteraceae bacterium]